MDEDFRSDYFDGLADNFPEEAVSEYKERRLSIQEMRDILEKGNEHYKTSGKLDLKQNSKTGLYYTEYEFWWRGDLLCNHYMAELLFANHEKVDWELMTDCYDYVLTKQIYDLLSKPLVWIPTSDINNKFIIPEVDNVATEVYPPEHFYFDDGRYGYYDQMRIKGILWFADHLPTKDSVYNPGRYDDFPATLHLWDRLTIGGYHDLRTTIEEIRAMRGYKKAIEIVELFREEWDNFVKVRKTDFWELEDYEKERIRKELFEEIEPYLQSWKTKVGDTKKKQKRQTYCIYIVPDAPLSRDEIEAELVRVAALGNVQRFVKRLMTYERLGYLDFLDDDPRDIYEYMKERYNLDCTDDHFIRCFRTEKK